MNTLDTYTCTDSWGLVYDAASSGDFIGTIQEITGYRSLCYIGSGIPGNDNAGFVLSGGFLQISVHAANKLYAKRYPGDPYSMPRLSLAMANITVVGGAAAVGSAPTAAPVGVSGIDDSGLKRAIFVNASGATVTDNSVMASDGVMLPIDSLAQTLGYTAGDLTTITVVYGGNTYVQTLTYTSGNITAISTWVKQ